MKNFLWLNAILATIAVFLITNQEVLLQLPFFKTHPEYAVYLGLVIGLLTKFYKTNPVVSDQE